MFSPSCRRIPSKSSLLISAALLVFVLVEFQLLVQSHNKKQISRKSIVFDIKTPNVFYCAQEKQADLDKMIVRAKPLERLCQFGGKVKPKKDTSDCYNDVDETDFACAEKKRFMTRVEAEQVTTSTSIESKSLNSGTDPYTGMQMLKSGFAIGGGIDQDHNQSPQKFSEAGVYITRLEPNGAGAMAGLKLGDRILQCNGHDFTLVTHRKAVEYIQKYPVLEMLIIRKDDCVNV